MTEPLRINQLHVKGLNGHLDLDIDFHNDINLLTGRNGSGKTTVLKLIWFAISGNLERILPEIEFSEFSLTTNQFAISLLQRQDGAEKVVDVTHRMATGGEPESVSVPAKGASEYLDQLNHEVVKHSKSSVFFPTFRRIEGGYAGLKDSRQSNNSALAASREMLHEGLRQFAQKLSVAIDIPGGYQHRFVASISTRDLVEILTRRYTDAAQSTNALSLQLTDFILREITSHSGHPDAAGAEAKLNSIRAEAQRMNSAQQKIMQPFSLLSSLCTQVFRTYGVRITQSLILGDTGHSIPSDQLSGGEKQMLSFLTYNMFFTSSLMFIDEPELSLHVDWQRQLFPMLLSQMANNQMFVATHSPFIYSRYPEKEIRLDSDRGDAQ